MIGSGLYEGRNLTGWNFQARISFQNTIWVCLPIFIMLGYRKPILWPWVPWTYLPVKSKFGFSTLNFRKPSPIKSNYLYVALRWWGRLLCFVPFPAGPACRARLYLVLFTGSRGMKVFALALEQRRVVRNLSDSKPVSECVTRGETCLR